MSRRKIIIGSIMVIIAAVAVYSYRELYRTNQDLRDVKAEVQIDAVTLLGEFSADEITADKKYRNKIIAVRGMVKGIDSLDNHYSIAMGDTNQLSSVRFSMDSSFVPESSNVRRGRVITVKGAITGFKKDDTGLLGDDIELNRCVLQQ